MLRVHHWMIRASVENAVSRIPFRGFARNFVQQHLTHSLPTRITPQFFERKVTHCQEHLRCFFAQNRTLDSPFSVVELGTGWYGTAPVAMFLCGADTILTYDLEPLLNKERLLGNLDMFVEYDDMGQLDRLLPWTKRDRLQHLRQIREESAEATLAHLLTEMRVISVVGDICQADIQPNSIDLIFSNNTLQHIPREVLLRIFAKFREIASSRCITCHHIVPRDHYADFDPGITPLNFLQYSERTWSLFNNSILYQNRLRMSDYQGLFSQSGWAPLEETRVQCDKSVLAGIRLAEQFCGYAEQELLTMNAWIAWKPAGNEPQVLGTGSSRL